MSRVTGSICIGGGTTADVGPTTEPVATGNAAAGITISTGGEEPGEPRRSNDVRRIVVKVRRPAPASAITSVGISNNR